MVVQTSLSRKFLGAGLTREHLIPIVAHHVGPQVVERGELPTTLLKTAGEVFTGVVRPFVPLQLVAGHKAPAAARIVALEGLLVKVLHDVQPQLVALAEGLAAAAHRTAPVPLAALHRNRAEIQTTR